MGADLRREILLSFAGDEVELVGAKAVGECGTLGLSGSTDAAEPAGWGALGIGVVIQQGVLGGEAALGLVKLGGAAGGGKPSLEK